MKKMGGKCNHDFRHNTGGNHLNWAGHRFTLTMCPSEVTLGDCIPIAKYTQ